MTGRKSEATAIERNLADLKEAKAMDVQTNSSNDRDLSSSPEDTRGFQGAEGAAGGRRLSLEGSEREAGTGKGGVVGE